MTIQSVMIDTNEPDWVKSLKFGEAPTAISHLEAGDLWVACSDGQILIVERKTPSDLLGTIKKRRLEGQCARMRDYSDWTYLVITGNLFWEIATAKITMNYKVTGWDMSAIWGMLVTIQELGIRVILCNGDSDFGPCVERLANRDRDEVKIYPPRQPYILNAGEKILCSLPGVGYEKTKALLKAYGTPALAFCNLTQVDSEDNVIHGQDGIRRATRSALGLDKYWPGIWPLPRDENEKDS